MSQNLAPFDVGARNKVVSPTTVDPPAKSRWPQPAGCSPGLVPSPTFVAASYRLPCFRRHRRSRRPAEVSVGGRPWQQLFLRGSGEVCARVAVGASRTCRRPTPERQKLTSRDCGGCGGTGEFPDGLLLRTSPPLLSLTYSCTTRPATEAMHVSLFLLFLSPLATGHVYRSLECDHQSDLHSITVDVPTLAILAARTVVFSVRRRKSGFSHLSDCFPGTS